MPKNKLESDYKGEMVAAVKKVGGYARRVEDQYAVGTLDLIFCLPKTGVILAEAKRFTHQMFEPSPRQYVEMKEIDEGGGVSLLIGVKGGVHYLHGLNILDHPRGRVYAKDCVVQQEGETFPSLLERWYKEKVHVR